MNSEQILDALEFIDDDMIECVNVLRKYPERHKYLWFNYVAVAACVVLAIFGGFQLLDSNTPKQESSSADTGTIQNNTADMFGATENKNEADDQITQGDNGDFRDEATGSAGSACFAASVYIEITEIGDNSFKGKVLKKAVVANKTHFEENQIVTVIYNESTNKNLHTLLIEDLSVGEKVYVFYGKIESDTIYTPRIEYELF